jgi:hypothetical protein
MFSSSLFEDLILMRTKFLRIFSALFVFIFCSFGSSADEMSKPQDAKPEENIVGDPMPKIFALEDTLLEQGIVRGDVQYMRLLGRDIARNKLCGDSHISADQVVSRYYSIVNEFNVDGNDLLINSKKFAAIYIDSASLNAFLQIKFCWNN